MEISRRRLVGAAGAGALAAVLPGGTGQAAAEEPFRALPGPPPKRPNLLVVLVDDPGWADLSSRGAPEIRTPNLDRLAASGVRFRQSYSASSVCSPARIGLYTGRYPGRLAGGLKEPIDAPNAVDGIPAGHPTLGSLVHEAGYSTALIGKWHCGFLPWFSPTRLGWQEFFGSFSGGMDYFAKLSHHNLHDLYENEVAAHDLRHYTDLVTERAVEFVRREHRKPWLLNLNYTTPRRPWEGPGDRTVSDELTAVCRAVVEDLDRAVGQVLDAVRRSGQLHNTLVFVASDNGGARFSGTRPLGGGTSTLAEGGMRVPTILSWPGALRPRQVHDAPVLTMDWTATFLELAGTRPAATHPLDGTSLAGHLFRGEALPARDLFWRLRGQRALRRGDLKYVRTGTTEALYDLAADVRERANLARKRPEDLAALRSAWEAVEATLVPYPA
ncbi:arylsulfatase A-like enzyme [Crossiella equi]|uniref:Arylsulfatase A-like enzyme n=1 Tax=Crossiella equi TaxID=130796 RepID=A0ABS5AQU6_9PSEU|nr:sulfatase-like hydrolase/transferase [Crossiella equi]MBP2478925.1 arylsulfatase A-like enzyme [Crossiella equi]